MIIVLVGDAPADEDKPEAPEAPKDEDDDDKEKPGVVTGGDPTMDANSGGLLASAMALFAAAGLAIRRRLGMNN